MEHGVGTEVLEEEELLTEVFVSEVLANMSVAGKCEVFGGGVGGMGEGRGGESSVSGSSPWKMLS